MHKILISIKPEYVKRILSGEKMYEYRKRVPADVKTVVIYATAPVKKIVGEFSVDNVLSMAPEELWNKTHLQSGITQEKFFRYFHGVSIAHALSIKEVIEYESPFDLNEVKIKRAPQSWQYIY